MKKNIDLIVNGIKPEKVTYDMENHSLVVLYPEQKEFKVGDKVRLKKDLNLKVRECYNGLIYRDKMDNVKNAILTIDRISESSGNIKAYNNIDGDWWWYSPEWLEHIVEDDVKFKVGDKVRFKKELVFRVSDNWLDLLPGIIEDCNDKILTIEYIDAIDGTCMVRESLYYLAIEWLEHIIEDEDDVDVKFKKGDILVSGNTLLIFDKYGTYNKENDLFHSIWNNINAGNRNWTSKYFKHATDEQKAQVHELLKKDGKRFNAETLEIEDLNISEIAFDLKTACKYLNKTIPNFSSLFFTLSPEDYHKCYSQITLQLIREAWNKFDGVEIDWDDNLQYKYYPVLDANERVKYHILNSSKHISGVCYSFSTSRRALQFGNQFKELLKTAMDI